jgi:hypothetical protein
MFSPSAYVLMSSGVVLALPLRDHARGVENARDFTNVNVT